MTTVDFHIPSEDALYGLCQRAKFYCKVQLEHLMVDPKGLNVVETITKDEYTAKLSSVETIQTSAISEMSLSDTVIEFSEDPNIGCKLRILQ